MGAMGAGALVGCGGGSDAPAGSEPAASGTDKPVIFYNRQPSNSSTGELDMTTLNYNKNTYYVGFDANQGGELEGTMIVDYIKPTSTRSIATATVSSVTSSPSATWATTTPSLVPWLP